MNRLIATLMAATMLLPTAATAQDRDGGRGGQRERGPRAEGGRDAGESRQRPWRDQMQSVDRGDPGADAPRREIARDRAADAPRPDAPRPDTTRPVIRQDDGRGNDGRGNDGFGNDGRRNDAQRVDRRDGQQERGDWNRNRDDGRRDMNRRDIDRRDPNWRNDGQRYDDRGRLGARRYGNDFVTNRDTGNRGGWNRGWRNDRQYDWNRYRNANRGAYRLPRYYAPSGWGGGYRRFGVGVTLSSGLWGQNYWIGDPYAYRLPEAYGPYRWVRYYGDALLIDLRSGLVVDTVYDIFW